MPHTYESEREAALRMESLSDGEYMSLALNNYAAAYGSEDKDRAWILTPFDTWEANPFYEGPPVPHPFEEEERYLTDLNSELNAESTLSEEDDLLEDDIPF